MYCVCAVSDAECASESDTNDLLDVDCRICNKELIPEVCACVCCLCFSMFSYFLNVFLCTLSCLLFLIDGRLVNVVFCLLYLHSFHPSFLICDLLNY